MTTTPNGRKPPSNGEHRLRSENLAFDIDVWYPCLAAHTFRSLFLPLTRAEAEAMIAYYNAAWRHVVPHAFGGDAVETLLGLEHRMDVALQEFNSDGPRGTAFLRLCGRSPKDGEPTDPQLRAHIWANYQATLSRMAAEEGISEDNDNVRVAAIARTDSWLKVTSGAEAMSLLLTSERVFSDMLDWIQYGEPEQLVFREFSNAFDLSTEFRCYIQNGTLQGISQYDTYAKHAYLQDPSHRALVVNAVLREWRKLRDCIETIDGSYCADFGVDRKKKVAQLIEISPFRNCTGPALFAWAGPTDLIIPERSDVQDDVLQGLVLIEDSSIAMGAVFRVRSDPIPGIGDLVEMNWDLRWSPQRVDTPRPYRELYEPFLPNTAVRTLQKCNKLYHQWFVEKEHLLFVYGTLKRNCHWHDKYMTGANFLGEVVTLKPQSLVIGQCGVPYLIGIRDDPKAVPVQGELWRLSEEKLQGIDEYEGIEKGHYSREEIEVARKGFSGTTIYKSFCYFYALKPGKSDVDSSLLEASRIAEYPAEVQKKNYKPIHHIQVKQLQYLGEEATT